MLHEVRNQWEEGLNSLSVINQDNRVLVILEKNGNYFCHRYFKNCLDEWICSVDCQNVEIGQVLSWLNNPKKI